MNNLVFISVASMGVMGILFGAFLAFAAKKFAVEEDPRIEQVLNALPGANCGACGYAGCSNFAEAVVKGQAPVSGCPVGGSAVAADLAEILGVDAGATSDEKKIAKVLCQGSNAKAKDKYKYEGIEDCVAASRLAGGPKACSYGCLGLSTCVKACPVNAITITDGIAVIDEYKCIGCEKCVVACPKNVIKMVPQGKDVHVLCNSIDKGKDVMQACKIGCIACQKCVKACKFDAIVFENNLARIDYSKCVNCMMCAEACPTNAIYANFTNRKKAFIIDDKCIGCTICSKNCNFEAIEGELKGKHKVLEDKCVGCGKCYQKCPKNAIEMK